MPVSRTYSYQSTQGNPNASNYSPFSTVNRGSGLRSEGSTMSQDPFNRMNADAARFNADAGLAKMNADTQKELAGQQDRTTRLGFDYSLAEARLPWDYRRGVFGQVFPLVQSLFGMTPGVPGAKTGGSVAVGGGFGGGSNGQFSTIGGTNTPLPNLPPDYVYSPDMIQQQVNAARATSDEGTASAKTENAKNMASKGFGSRSPIAMAMDQAADNAGRARNADSEREIRFDAAGANANQALNVGQLAQQAWQDWNSLDVERRRTQLNSLMSNQSNLASLISALSGLAG